MKAPARHSGQGRGRQLKASEPIRICHYFTTMCEVVDPPHKETAASQRAPLHLYNVMLCLFTAPWLQSKISESISRGSAVASSHRPRFACGTAPPL
jgi:hypothetical protein